MKLKLLIFFQLFILLAYSQNGQNNSVVNRIREEKFIAINGIEQWITIKGDSTKPVVLFIHGGPGSPLSPYSDAIYSKREKDFILVQWDQRGTARTYGRNTPEELTPEYLKSNPLTIEQMTSDGIELTKYLISHLHKQKIILFGTSWGSVLGVKMALKNPELFYAYIGHSQMVNPSASTLYAYQKVYQMAQVTRDQKTLDVLNSIGKPPYDTAKSLGQLMRIIKKYQQKESTPAPASWFELPPEYDNEKDNQNRSDGDDYSFINYAGDKRLGIASIASTINFFKDGLVFKIPVYFIQGEDDIQTPAVINKRYLKKISAPQKKFILLPKADHGFNQSVVDMQFNLMTQYIKPLINRN
jgi:pimeloyl-ACP methyl ester carboxylesterase